MSAALKETPPRGKQYAVARMSHVAGGPAQPVTVVGSRRFDSLAAATKAAREFDARLTPVVVIADKL